uniref:Uncharacterized protein n=1 Tax=viral metagenome TaxID=1070528 RepID=A0A6M3LAI0_9ZZZZ
MADTPTETTVTTVPQPVTSAPKDAVEVTDQHKPDLPETKYQPLFGDEVISEAQLQGEDEQKPDESSKETSPEDKAAAPGPAEDGKKTAETEKKDETKPSEGDAKKAETKEEATKKADEEKAPQKPPKGYVPHQALQEAREVNRELSATIREMRQEVNELKTLMKRPPEDRRTRKEISVLDDEDEGEPGTSAGEEFTKLLTQAEYRELTELDPPKALRYLDWKQDHQQELNARKREATEDEETVKQAWQGMEEEVPGLFDETKTVRKELSMFAKENGFDGRYLEVLTNPETLVIAPGMKKPVVLGHGATALVRLIHRVRASVTSKTDEVALRKAIEAELTPRLTKEITDKFTGRKSTVRSIADIPGSEEHPTMKAFNEREYANMNEEERERALGGGAP